ncbi:MAG: GIY-YIG nuclease family protein [Bacteroidales bacterium]|nr:GIY-YIG nuclease family protein [Bacteroidales bacterium]
MSKEYFIYILFNKPSGTLYTGVTSALKERIIEHKLKMHPLSFTAKYNVNKLGYYEVFQSIHEAIDREKQIKSWSRARKIQLIKSTNANWMDLFELL